MGSCVKLLLSAVAKPGWLGCRAPTENSSAVPQLCDELNQGGSAVGGGDESGRDDHDDDNNEGDDNNDDEDDDNNDDDVDDDNGNDVDDDNGNDDDDEDVNNVNDVDDDNGNEDDDNDGGKDDDVGDNGSDNDGDSDDGGNDEITASSAKQRDKAAGREINRLLESFLEAARLLRNGLFISVIVVDVALSFSVWDDDGNDREKVVEDNDADADDCGDDDDIAGDDGVMLVELACSVERETSAAAAAAVTDDESLYRSRDLLSACRSMLDIWYMRGRNVGYSYSCSSRKAEKICAIIEWSKWRMFNAMWA